MEHSHVPVDKSDKFYAGVWELQKSLMGEKLMKEKASLEQQ